MTSSAEPSRGRVPDFFLVGHSKSGTTALYEMLRRHPQVFMPDLKEPVFFASELPRQAHRYTAPATLEEYLSLFAPAGPDQRLGEASASYLWSHTAAGRIAEAQPQARIIAILREPASFLRSLHLQCVQSHYENEKDLARALALEPSRREGRNIPPRSGWPQVLMYSEHVRYVEQLRRYRAVFPEEQVLTLVYDDFRADNEGTLREVLRFIGVDATAPIEPVEANPTVRMRSQWLDELVHSVSVGGGPVSQAVKGTVKALLPRKLRRGALKATQRHLVVGEPDSPDAQLMLEIRRRYRGEVEALSEYLGRDLITLWGYDSAA
ncbi:MAG TPA: sulfotransferase [Solirubrobacteraceae bacterium]|nr:sulfotransferase [Solirubrobacteraceae bacterium]